MNSISRLTARLRQLAHRGWTLNGQVQMDGPLTPQLFNVVADHCLPMPEEGRINALWMMLAHGRSTGKLAYVETFWADQSGLRGRGCTLQWQGEWWCNTTARWTPDYRVFIEALDNEVRENTTHAIQQKPLPPFVHATANAGDIPSLVFPLHWTIRTVHLDGMETAPDSRAWLAEFEAKAAVLALRSTLDSQIPQAASGVTRPRRL
jgi:hypothetical protein